MDDDFHPVVLSPGPTFLFRGDKALRIRLGFLERGFNYSKCALFFSEVKCLAPFPQKAVCFFRTQEDVFPLISSAGPGPYCSSIFFPFLVILNFFTLPSEDFLLRDWAGAPRRIGISFSFHFLPDME